MSQLHKFLNDCRSMWTLSRLILLIHYYLGIPITLVFEDNNGSTSSFLEVVYGSFLNRHNGDLHICFEKYKIVFDGEKITIVGREKVFDNPKTKKLTMLGVGSKFYSIHKQAN